MKRIQTFVSGVACIMSECVQSVEGRSMIKVTRGCCVCCLLVGIYAAIVITCENSLGVFQPEPIVLSEGSVATSATHHTCLKTWTRSLYHALWVLLFTRAQRAQRAQRLSKCTRVMHFILKCTKKNIFSNSNWLGATADIVIS